MSAQQKQEWEEKQKNHFDRMALQYELHYSDETSQKYRSKFIDEPMTKGLDFSGRKVLEAMCGSGQTTHHLLLRGAKVTGLDISPELILSFKKRWPQCDAICGSIFNTGIENESFDYVIIVGGLHHIQPDVHQAIDEIHRVLKPGGYFCFYEPHANSFPDRIRKIWYKIDPLFEKNEAAVHIENLEQKNSHRFDFIKKTYGGNIAFLFVLNSLIFRIPLSWKRFYTPILLPIESAINALQTKKTSCFAVCQWKKKI